MRIQFNREVLVGARTHRPGEVLEVPDELGHRHVRAGSAAVAVELPAAAAETAEDPSPAAAETADASPLNRRRRP